MPTRRSSSVSFLPSSLQRLANSKGHQSKSKSTLMPHLRSNCLNISHYIMWRDFKVKSIKCPRMIVLKTEEPGTYISNLVITHRKWDPEKIQVALDCQQVNKDVYQPYEPIHMSEELRHKLEGCDCFSMLDIRNCYHQFEIEKEGRKLFAFHTPYGIFCYKGKVMGTSPASSEIQKHIREMIKDCTNSLNIKDDIQ